MTKKLKIGEKKVETLSIKIDVFAIVVQVTTERINNLNYNYETTVLDAKDVDSISSDVGNVPEKIKKEAEKKAIEEIKNKEYKELREEIKLKKEAKKDIGQESIFGGIH